MTSKYYQHELDNLRELAVEFAAAHPNIAPQLGGPRPDPDVERILEGVAFLTAQIRETLEQGFPEFAQGILNQIFPHYLRPIPSATIIQFTPKTILNGKLPVPKGTYIDSAPVEGVSCRFRTCYDVDVLPLRLERVATDSVSGGRRIIDLHFELQSMHLNDWKSDTLRFCIGGDYASAADLFFLLMRYIENVEIEGEGGLPCVLPRNSLQPLGLSKQEAILDYPSNSFPAYRLLQEYFLLKEKFLFMELSGLSTWRERGASRKFAIRFTLKDIPISMPRVDTESFLLHATPAINLFTTDAEPVLLDNRRNEIRIRPARDQGGKVQVYSVDNVVGRARGASGKTEYVPLGMNIGNAGKSPVYQVTFKPAQLGEYVEPYMNVSYPDGYQLPGAETLSVQLTCSNGDLPTALRRGDVSKPTSSTSELVEFKNVLPPTEHQQPPMGGTMLWRLLSHLSLNYLPIADTENLRSLLGLYIFSGADKKTEATNRRRIAGINNISVKPSDRLVQGTILRGQEIEVSVDHDHFLSRGDLFVFGAVLEKLFSSFASLNVYTALSISDTNTGENYEWPASLGERPLI